MRIVDWLNEFEYAFSQKHKTAYKAAELFVALLGVVVLISALFFVWGLEG